MRMASSTAVCLLLLAVFSAAMAANHTVEWSPEGVANIEYVVFVFNTIVIHSVIRSGHLHCNLCMLIIYSVFRSDPLCANYSAKSVDDAKTNFFCRRPASHVLLSIIW